MSRPTSACIDLDALRRNLLRIRELAPRSRVMAVVKADGYGHGLERVAHALEGADAFGVAAISDAERLRAAGIAKRIVLLSGFVEPGDLPLLQRLRLDTVVHHESQLAMLEAASLLPDQGRIQAWLKLNTGMNRLGFPADAAGAAHARLRALPIVGDEICLMTHLARSDEFDSAFTLEQCARFELATAALDGPRSLANSAAVLGWPQTHADWVRPGGALFGLSVVAGRPASEFGLEAVMTLGTRVIAVNSVEPGAAVGYGGGFVADRPMRIAITAIGYGDGYPRLAPSGSPVVVRGVRTRTVGRVSMDLLAIDVTALPEVQVGDRVELWGKQLPVEEVAAAAGTISYELTCGITRRVRFMER
ncbi:MAG: alanine racemase [Xanthomonadales bacterium]|nr:alanine racemase [Xanthomonadales bacterium]